MRTRLGAVLGPALKSALFLFVVGYFLVTSARDFGPAWSARSGRGTPGTFTAQHCERGRTGCFWRGTFVSDNGRIRRSGVGLASGGTVAHVGQRVRALDTGDRKNVFPAGGGEDWLVIMIMFAMALGTLSVWTLIVPIGSLRRRRASLTR